MQFATQQLNEFKELYKKESGKDLTDQEALDMATKLVNIVRLVYKPLPENSDLKSSKNP